MKYEPEFETSEAYAKYHQCQQQEERLAQQKAEDYFEQREQEKMMTFEEAGKQQEENKKRDKATRYSDQTIQTIIDGPNCILRDDWESAGMSEIVAALTAQAMIAYNEMIDRRWENA